MPRITRVTTRLGDAGETSLGSGKRVSKSALRVAAYGAVDELNSVVGVTLATGVDARIAAVLAVVQNDLLDVGADLSVPYARGKPAARIAPQLVERLEREQAVFLSELPPLANFVLPGGSLGAAQLHFARTVCRRAEREVVALNRRERVNMYVMSYLNRLSDLLFVLARCENAARGIPEPTWRQPERPR